MDGWVVLDEAGCELVGEPTTHEAQGTQPEDATYVLVIAPRKLKPGYGVRRQRCGADLRFVARLPACDSESGEAVALGTYDTKLKASAAVASALANPTKPHAHDEPEPSAEPMRRFVPGGLSPTPKMGIELEPPYIEDARWGCKTLPQAPAVSELYRVGRANAFAAGIDAAWASFSEKGCRVGSRKVFERSVASLVRPELTHGLKPVALAQGLAERVLRAMWETEVKGEARPTVEMRCAGPVACTRDYVALALEGEARAEAEGGAYGCSGSYVRRLLGPLVG